MTRDRWFILASILLVATSVILRYLSIPYINDDMNVHNLVWYKTIITQGRWNALGTTFTNYSPPYSYFLVFASLFKDFIAPLTAIKLIPIVFDVLGAVLAYKIVRTRYASGSAPLLAASIYLTAPTVILNSSYWGQVDSIYTFFILACVYFLLSERYNLAWISFGVSFAIKAQAIFIAPLLLILLLHKRIRWSGLLWVPAIYFLSALPTILLGRPALDVLSVYITQSGTYETLSRNAPNLYIFFPQSWYSVMLPIGAILAVVIIATWAASSAKYLTSSIGNKNIALYALLSVSLVPFLLPKMHDRYFYPADTLSIVVAFLEPKLWFIPLLFQAVSLPGYAAFLFDSSQTLVYTAALLNTLTIGFLLKRQSMDDQGQVNLKMKRILSILLTLVIPIILVGAGIRSIFTPVFIRAEYFLFRDQGGVKEWNSIKGISISQNTSQTIKGKTT
jgi:Gpi18-like mannosyltransferase